MALPTLVKTWEAQRNIVVPAAGSRDTVTANVMIAINSALVGMTVPSTIRGSSDSVAAGLDGVNRLSSPSAFVAGTGAHSWIVYRHPTGLEICIDLRGSALEQGDVYVSRAGFSGGSTTARPTATDEVVLNRVSDSCDWAATGYNAQHVLQIMQSTDGANTIVLVCSGGVLVKMWLIGTAAVPVSGWTAPYYAGFIGNAQSVFTTVTYDLLYKDQSSFGKLPMIGFAPSGPMNLFGSAESTGSPAAPYAVTTNAADSITGEYAVQPIGLVSTTTGARGRHGVLPDLFYVAPSLANGTVFGTNALAKFGDFVVPWGDTSAPQVS